MRSGARGLVTVVVSLLIPIVPFLVIGELPGEHWLTSAGSDSTLFGALGAALLLSDVLLPVPSSVVGALLGARLGFEAGWLWGWAGLCAGNLLGYAGGRLFALKTGCQLPETSTLLLFFASRPVPIVAEAFCILAGTNRTPLLPFLAATAAGNAVYMAALAGSGAAFLPAGAAGPGLAVPMLVPAAAWFAWRLAHRRSRKVTRSTATEEARCST